MPVILGVIAFFAVVAFIEVYPIVKTKNVKN